MRISYNTSANKEERLTALRDCQVDAAVKGGHWEKDPSARTTHGRHTPGHDRQPLAFDLPGLDNRLF